jgi:hypothetical protein
MARIIVIADMPRRPNIDAPVLMDEQVKPDHLADEHSSHQIIERMAWAVLDAEEVSREIVGRLTQRQIDRLAKLPAGHKVVSGRRESPLVERPDGRLLRVQPSGRLVTTTRVSGTESYLRLERC